MRRRLLRIGLPPVFLALLAVGVFQGGGCRTVTMFAEVERGKAPFGLSLQPLCWSDFPYGAVPTRGTLELGTLSAADGRSRPAFTPTPSVPTMPCRFPKDNLIGTTNNIYFQLPYKPGESFTARLQVHYRVPFPWGLGIEQGPVVDVKTFTAP